MPLLTFSREWEPKLMDQSKKQTIRENALYWFKLAGYRSVNNMRVLDIMASRTEQQCFDENRPWSENTFFNQSDNPLHIYLGSPRSCASWVRKLGRSWPLWTVRPIYGRDIDDRIADMDGFSNAQDLDKWLMESHGMTMSEVESHIWVLIRFVWREGPHA